MEKSSSEDLMEVREELMVLPSEQNPILRKAHFLKPFVTAIDDPVSEEFQCELLFPSLDLNLLSSKFTFSGWKLAINKYKLWVTKMVALHEPIWKKAGIFEAIMASTYRIYRNTDLVLAVAEKWCPKTNTFVFPFGEATITLEDVMVLLGFSVLGSPIFAPLESPEKRETKNKLEKVWLEIGKDNGWRVNQVSWLSRFMNSGDEIELEHEAFLVLWLSNFVFPSRHPVLTKEVIPIAIHLARGTRIALGPAVLASLYQDLGLLKGHIVSLAKAEYPQNFSSKLILPSLFTLVQVWAWERFSKLRPEPKMLKRGEPRLAQWHNLKDRSLNVKQLLASSGADSFEWRPYTKRVKNWNFPLFYAEEGTWVLIKPDLDDDFVSFARCLRSSQLFSIGCVENYRPNHVAMQFGLDQDLPGRTHQSKLTRGASSDDYNNPMDGLKLYMPSRLATPLVTARYFEWWKKSAPKFHDSSATQKESTFIACNTGDHESAKELPLALVFQKELEKCGLSPPYLVPKSRRSKNRRRRKDLIAVAETPRPKGNRDEPTSMNGDEPTSMNRDDAVEASSGAYCRNLISSECGGCDNHTTARVVGSCKEPGVVKERAGHADERVTKRAKHGEENNSSDPPQKMTSTGSNGDNNEPPEMRQTGEQNDEAENKEDDTMTGNPSDESYTQSKVGNSAEEPDCLLNGNVLEIGGTVQSNDRFHNTPNSVELLDNVVEREDGFGDAMVVHTVTKQVEINGSYRQSVEVPGLELEMRIMELKKILAEAREWKNRNQTKARVSARF